MEIVMIFFILINRYMYMAKMEREKKNKYRPIKHEVYNLYIVRKNDKPDSSEV